jgi:saccharopine dehydrogenase (NAD+, L-lysine-forming)
LGLKRRLKLWFFFSSLPFTIMSAQPHLWLRAETKPMEHRASITPSAAKTLLDAGFKITVERSPERIFDDEEYET